MFCYWTLLGVGLRGLFYLSALGKRGVVFARFCVGPLLDLEAVHWVSCLIWLVVWMRRTLGGGKSCFLFL